MSLLKKKEETEYYSLENILKCGCNWMLLFGMRSNGKSYAVKDYVLKEAWKDHRPFLYLRRWGEDIRVKQLTYFDDMPIYEYTDGEYMCVTPYQGNWYWGNVLESGKIERGPKSIGRYCALSEAERYKSQVFNTENLIYEEFLTNRLYLGSRERPEPRLLMQFVSTVARDRDIKVFMIGNTISRVCPYIDDWSLKGMRNMKAGTIEIYHLRGENGIVDFAVENCEVVKTRSKMFFGLSSKQITAGEWEVDEMPKLLKPYEYYDMIYEVCLKASDFSYCMQLMYDGSTEGLFVYVYPLTGKRVIERVITDTFNTDPMVTRCFRSDIRPEVIMAQCFRRNKVCYSDNLTGTDFKQVLKMYNLEVSL